MRRYLNNIAAMTLVELLVATIIVGIIMLGTVSIELAMRRTFATTSKSASLSMRISAAMVHFSRNVSQAIGDRGSPGIRVDTSVPSCTRLFVRHENGETPTDYSDDVWVSYRHNSSSTDASLLFCDQTAVAGNGDPTSDPSCLNDTCAGNAYEITRVRDLAYTRVIDDTDLQYYTEVTLNSYYNNSQAYHPLNNPKIENMTTKISYMSHSW